MNQKEKEPLPEWAATLANGDYTLPGACLPTRDGRKTGNAVVVYKTVPIHIVGFPTPTDTYLVVTDAGNSMRMTVSEMESLFYPPEFITKEFLPNVMETLSWITLPHDKT